MNEHFSIGLPVKVPGDEVVGEWSRLEYKYPLHHISAFGIYVTECWQLKDPTSNRCVISHYFHSSSGKDWWVCALGNNDLFPSVQAVDKVEAMKVCEKWFIKVHDTNQAFVDGLKERRTE